MTRLRRLVTECKTALLILFLTSTCLLFMGYLGVFEYVGDVPNSLTFIIPIYYTLSLPICLYISSIIIWTFKETRRDIIPSVVTLFGLVFFIPGLFINLIPLLVPSLVGRGSVFSYLVLHPIFTLLNLNGLGLLLSLPYLLILIVVFSISIILCFLGVCIGCQFKREKPDCFKSRRQKAGTNLIVVFLITYLLFFQAWRLFDGLPFPGRFASMQARHEWGIATLSNSYETVADGLKTCSLITNRIGNVRAVAPTAAANWIGSFDESGNGNALGSFVIELTGDKGAGVARVTLRSWGLLHLKGDFTYRAGWRFGRDEISFKNCPIESQRNLLF